MPNGVSKLPTRAVIPSMYGREKPGGRAGQVTWYYGSPSIPHSGVGGQKTEYPELREPLGQSSRKASLLPLLVSKGQRSLAFRDLGAKEQIALRPPEAVDNTSHVSGRQADTYC